MDTLSPRLQNFALNIALGQSQYQAAVNAGYAESTATAQSKRMLETVGVKQLIEQHKQRLAEASQGKVAITPEWIAEQLADVAVNAEPAPRVAALRTLADIHGMLGGGQRTLSDQAQMLVEALGRGLSQGREQPKALEVQARELPAGGDGGE